MNVPTFSEEEQAHAKIVVGRVLIEKGILNFYDSSIRLADDDDDLYEDFIDVFAALVEEYEDPTNPYPCEVCGKFMHTKMFVIDGERACICCCVLWAVRKGLNAI